MPDGSAPGERPAGSPDVARTFDEMRESRPHGTDADLATLIREHGRACLAARIPVSLTDYLGIVEDLRTRRAPLDAAIDIALRSRAGASRPDEGTVDRLIGEHPELELPIREAAVLAHALWSTGELRAEHAPDPDRSLPLAFGPALDDGDPRYTLTRRLGRGASGEVYLGEDRRLSDDESRALVAIKILRAGKRDEFSRMRFIEEATKVRRLDHPGCVRVFDRAETDDGEDFIVYEFIPGGDLHAWLGRRADPLPVRDGVRLVASIARAVQAAHGAGIVHLDLKPANILMTVDDRPKVADFDLARRAGAAEDDRQGPLGTYAFMAPEQFLVRPGAAAPPADIYAIGGILYWLVTGCLPNGDTREEIAERHAARRAPSFAAFARRRPVDRDLVAIVRRALDPESTKRHDSAGALAGDLEAWLRREPIRWTRPGVGRIVSLFARRRPAVFTLLIFLLVALVSVIVALEAARRLAAIAASERLEAEVNRVNLEAEQRWKQEAASQMARLGATLAQASKTGLAGETLTALWVLEWLHGPSLLTNPDELRKLWNERIGIIEGLLAERRAEGGNTALETLTLETILGFWLTRAGEHDRAIPMLRENLARWRAKLEPSDPWLGDVEAILLCAQGRRVVDRAGESAVASGEVDDARSIASSLREHDARLAPRDDGAQLRLLIQETLVALYAPAVLDDQERREAASAAIGRLGISVPPAQ